MTVELDHGVHALVELDAGPNWGRCTATGCLNTYPCPTVRALGVDVTQERNSS